MPLLVVVKVKLLVILPSCKSSKWWGDTRRQGTGMEQERESVYTLFLQFHNDTMPQFRGEMARVVWGWAHLSALLLSGALHQKARAAEWGCGRDKQALCNSNLVKRCCSLSGRLNSAVLFNLVLFLSWFESCQWKDLCGPISQTLLLILIMEIIQSWSSSLVFSSVLCVECDCTAYVYNISARARQKLVHLGPASRVAIAAQALPRICNTLTISLQTLDLLPLLFTNQTGRERSHACSRMGEEAAGSSVSFSQDIGKRIKAGLRKRVDLRQHGFCLRGWQWTNG